MSQNAPEGLTIFSSPETRRRRLKTTNRIEQVNKEIKHRTRATTLFPKEAFLPRLARAVLMEIGEGWEAERFCLRMEFNGLPMHKP